MVAPAVDLLLRAWEDGRQAAPSRRSLGLLGASLPDGASDPAELTVGERNLALLRLREDLFGDRVEALGSCPACGADLDVTFEVSALLAALPAAERESREAVVEGYTILIRPVRGSDLLAALEDPTGDPEARLLTRCVERVTTADGEVLDLVPEGLVARVAEELVRRDPAARIEVGLACAECGHHWDEVLDVGGFVWREVDAWAHRTLRAVHVLARAYGWREADILALTPPRRSAYLHLVGE